jgi:5'-methylthioinosine phosphorylase
MLAMLCGSGIDLLPFNPIRRRSVETPYGPMSAELEWLDVGGNELLALRRHGPDHRIPPHQVNYRANLWGLHAVGARQCLAVHTVGTLDTDFPPGTVALPSQLIDYSYGREHSYSDGSNELQHVEFDPPFDAKLTAQVVAAAHCAGVTLRIQGVYGVTQGPRLETAAEIDRLGRDGCTMVGMTAMPEAGLARELGLAYVSCAVAVNWAAGRSPLRQAIHGQIVEHSQAGFAVVAGLLAALAGQT